MNAAGTAVPGGGLSECARSTNAHEARFRVQAPNSKPRAIAIVALGHASGGAIEDVACEPWSHADFFVALHPGSAQPRPATSEPRFVRFDGVPADPAAIVTTADLVVIVASAGDVDTAAAAKIVGACRQHRKSLMAVILSDNAASECALRNGLTQLRPHLQMLVLASEASYLETLLTSFGA